MNTPLTRKKILSVLLFFTLFVSAFSIPVFAGAETGLVREGLPPFVASRFGDSDRATLLLATGVPDGVGGFLRGPRDPAASRDPFPYHTPGPDVPDSPDPTSDDGSSSSGSSGLEDSSSSSSGSSSNSSSSGYNRNDRGDAEDALRDARKELDNAEDAIDEAKETVNDSKTTRLDDDDIDDAEDDYDRARELYRDAADAITTGNYDLAVEKAEDAEALAEDITEDLDVATFDRGQDYSSYSQSSSFDSDRPSSSASRSQSQYDTSASYSYSATQKQGAQRGAEESIVVLSTATQPQKPVDVKKPFFNRSVFAGLLLVFVGLLVVAVIVAAVMTMRRSKRATL